VLNHDAFVRNKIWLCFLRLLLFKNSLRSCVDRTCSSLIGYWLSAIGYSRSAIRAAPFAVAFAHLCGLPEEQWLTIPLKKLWRGRQS
jgi:hypothetical protein